VGKVLIFHVVINVFKFLKKILILLYVWSLIDIKPEYCELARLYIAGQKYRIHKDQKRLKTL
jgi:hypothetical protein